MKERTHRIELLTAEEKKKLLIEWNNTAAEYPRDKCIHEGFEAQVKKTPDHAALVFASHQLTYLELDERSTRWAKALQKQGVKPDILVGICAERSIEMMAGIMGILKAGGAYVPIDPTYPQARLTYILEDSGVKTLLTQEKLEKKVSGLPVHKDYEVIILDQQRTEFQKVKELTKLARIVQSFHLAYAIYTSGSTGKPKGVIVEHQKILNTLYALQARYPVGPGDTYLLKTNFVFDVSLTELWGWFMGAGGVVILEPGQEKDPLAILKVLAERRVTHINFVPSMLASFVYMVSKSDLEAITALKYVMVAGEAFPRRLAQESQKKFPPGVRIENIYGPTEISIYGTWFSVKENGERESDKTVPIGKPLYNVQAYVLSQEGALQPIGTAGELHIAGAGLARGYLNQPELTREKFIANPFKTGTSMYKTGDLAWWLPDGNIEFLGRQDNQVKIRGFRIELEEIERQLVNHKDIRDAVVIARNPSNNKDNTPQDQALEKYLCAYIISERELPVSGLQEYLLQTLPGYMIPSFFVRLKSFPLSISGKVDKKALPEPEVKISYVAPTTGEEIKCCKIWEELFGFKPIGIRDNFFSLGGNSLLVGRLKIRVKESFGTVISFSDLYENPTIEALVHKIHRLDRKESEFPPIKKLPGKNNIPLSIQQEQVWYLCQLVPNNRAYNFQFTLRFQGKFNKKLFESCLTEIIHRHEIFWTTFPTVRGKPIQLIHEPWEAEIAVVDLRHIPGKQERERQLEELLKNELAITFDFTKLPLIGFKVFLLEEEAFLLLQIEHHFVHDGWSNAIFLQELKVLYEAYLKADTSPLPGLPIQFSDYAIWQREWLDSDFSEKQLDYWIKTLEGCPDILELPADKPRPSMQSFNGDLIRLYFPVELYQALRRFCREQETTLFVTLFSAFAVLLHLYTHQEDLLIGTALVNRRLEETTPLIGMLVNSIVLRIKLQGEQLFNDFIKSVQEVVLQAHENQETPLEKIIHRLFLRRDSSMNPLFQVMFSFHDSPVPTMQFPDLHGEYRILHNGTAKMDINVICLPGAEQRIGMENPGEEEKLEILWEYNTDIFKKETMERMVNHYLTILADLLHKNQEKVSNIELIEGNEKRKILYDFNHTETGYPEDKCIHERFEEQVKKTPGNAAVVLAGQHLTYQELDERSTTLALYLQKQGIKPDRLVGICMEHSLETIVSILGILRSGGVYVPIDSEYPPARITYMLKNVGAEILLTQEKLEEKVCILLAGEDCRIIALDRDWGQIEKTRGKLKKEARPGHLAYVIYTSGSTGKPKGAANFHRGFMNLIDWYCRAFHATAQDKVICFSPFGFDLTQKNFVSILTIGGTLYLVSQLDPRVIAETLFKNKITWLNCAPSAFYLLVEEDIKKLISLRIVLLGGEPILLEKLKKWRQDTKEKTTLVNTYGPTESSDVVTFYPVPGFFKERSIPIGRPVFNTRIYILNYNLKPVPIGVSGEIHIAGTGLARGYLNQAELTQEKFIANPFSPGMKMYRSGDLARWLPEGDIEFLGRIDHQVKIRGLRIECGEIETELAQHAGIREAVVMARSVNDTSQLVAYYVAVDKGKVLEVSEIRSHLKKTLPEYMIPAVFVPLESIPLTPNGKVDREALLKHKVELYRSQEYAAPRTETEKHLARIWEEVLGIEKVGIYDNFFELGGHSLLAIQIISRINKELPVEVLLGKLVEAPNIEGLSKAIEASHPYQAAAIASIQRPDQLPLSYAQERLWFLAQLGYSQQYHVPKVMKIKGHLDHDALQKAFNFIAARHEILRTGFKTVDDQTIQVIEAAPHIRIEKRELKEFGKDQQGRDWETLIREFVQRPFDLGQAPLMRVILVRLEAEMHILGMCLHHIIVDGWSMWILTREISQAYAAYKKGNEPGMAGLKIQYADYAVWQREVMTEARLDNELSYWKKYLAGYNDLDLPTDYPRPRQLSGRGGRVLARLEPEQVNRLITLCQAKQVTLFTGFMASVCLLLGRYSRQEDFCLGMPVANRNYREIEDLVGFFVNTLVIRVHMEEQPTLVIGKLLKKIQEELVAAQDRQNVPFEKVVETIQPKRDLSRTPIFQVLVNYVNTRREEFQFGECQSQDVEFDYGISKFDLTFDFIEQTSGGPGIRLEYNRDLYEKETIQRMGGSLVRIITSLVEAPGKTIDEIELLTAEAKQKLLIQWNDITARYPKDKCIHEVLAEQVKRTPDKAAMVFAEQTLTYRELEERSAALAMILQTQGVKWDSIVGICMERSLEMVVAIVGILKAGGAYLPIEPAYPGERTRYMLADSGTEVVLTAGTTGTLFQEGEKVKMVDLSTLLPLRLSILPSAHRRLSPWFNAPTASLAYVIYTSGSTGKPKGVVVAHQQVLNTLYALQGRYPLESDDRYLLKTNYIFDVSVTELFGWFMGTGALVVLEPGQEKDPLAILRVLRERRVTHINFVPSMLGSFLDIVPGAELEAIQVLKYVMVAGEAFPRRLARECQQKFSPSVRIENIYGPTEISVYATWFSVNDIKDSASQVPIGKPLYNVQAYVLSQGGSLQPLGVPGELHIGGAGLARGYLNNPELTAQNFLTVSSRYYRFYMSHMSYIPYMSSIIYRTGDLARWLAEGDLEFLGRIDQQVKVRGFRIECGEIEAVLARHPYVQEAVVVARHVNDTPQLIAYYVPTNKDKVLETNEIRNHLKDKLPEYMVPVGFVSLETLPLTASGKVDRKTLSKQEVQLRSSQEYVAPRTETEKQLARVWEEVLGIERVGIYDNFFELGGHSLLAIRMVIKIRQRLGIECPLINIFDYATLYRLSMSLPALPGPMAEPVTDLKIPKKNIEPNIFFPLTNTQFTYWLFWLGSKETVNLYRIYDVKGPIDGLLLEQAYNELLQRHESLWICISSRKPLQKLIPPKPIPLTIIDLRGGDSRSREEKMEKTMTDGIYTPFDLTSPPLIRLSLIQLGDHRYKLLLVAPHIILDDEAINIIFDELMVLYQAFVSHQPLPPKRPYVKFSDYVYWEQDAAQQSLRQDADYWQQKLDGSSVLLVPDSYLLPSKKPEGPYSHLVKLDSALLDALAKISRQHNVSLQMSLTALVAILLHRIISQGNIGINFVFENRVHQDIKHLAANIAIPVVIPIRLSQETSFPDLIAQIKHTTLEAYDHIRSSWVIPLWFLSRNRLQNTDSFGFKVKKNILRFITWLITRVWFPAHTYPPLIYAALTSIANKSMPRDGTGRKMHGMSVNLNIPPDFHQISGTSRYICDAVFNPGTLPDNCKPEKALKSEQVYALFFIFNKDEEGLPQLKVKGHKLTPAALQQLTTWFHEVIAAVVKNPGGTILELTTKEQNHPGNKDHNKEKRCQL